MKIVLKPMDLPSPPEGAIVGTLDGQPLLRMGREWRTSARDYTTAELGEALVEAVDEAATSVLGPEWVTNLARLSQLNRRSTSKDRIARFGIPGYVLVWLGKAAASRYPRAIGHHLMALDIIQSSALGVAVFSQKTGRPMQVDLEARGIEVAGVLAEATDIFDTIQADRHNFGVAKPFSDY